jgi:Protein of unknown function (DUF2970)
MYGRPRRLDAMGREAAPVLASTTYVSPPGPSPCSTMNADPNLEDRRPPKAGFMQIALAVFWSFFGVRKQRNLEEDAITIKPQHAIVAGVIGMVLFVLVLVTIVRLILSYA